MCSSTMRAPVAILLATVAACASNESSPRPPMSAGPSARPAVPTALESLESALEDVGEAARAKEWAKARQLLRRVQDSWSSSRSRAVADGASGRSVASIDPLIEHLAREIASQNSKAAESNANAICGAIAELFDLYANVVPVDVLRLDVAFRRAQIGAEYSEWSEVAGGLSDARTTWLRLRSGPLAIRSSGEATRQSIESVIARLARALDEKSAGAVETSASEGLELVDDLERAFR